MKKILAALFIMTMGATLLVGCGGSENTESKSDTNTNQVVKEEEETEPAPEVIDLGGQVIMDNEVAKITVHTLSVYEDKYDEAQLSVTVENKAQENGILIGYAKINQYEVNAMWRVEENKGSSCLDIPVGETKDVVLELWDREIKAAGQNSTDIVLGFEIGENYEIVESNHFYPYGEDVVVKYSRVLDEDDVVVIDNEYVYVVFTEGYKDEEVINIDYYIENKTDKDIYHIYSDETIDGELWNFYRGEDVIPANAVIEDSIYLGAEEVEYMENPISYDDIKEIKYTLWILDASTFTEDTFDDIWAWEYLGENRFQPEVYSLGSVQENYNPQNFHSPEEE